MPPGPRRTAKKRAVKKKAIKKRAFKKKPEIVLSEEDRKKVESLSTTVTALTGELNSLDSEIKTQEAAVKKLKSSRKTISSQVTRAKKKIKEVEVRNDPRTIKNMALMEKERKRIEKLAPVGKTVFLKRGGASLCACKSPFESEIREYGSGWRYNYYKTKGCYCGVPSVDMEKGVLVVGVEPAMIRTRSAFWPGGQKPLKEDNPGFRRYLLRIMIPGHKTPIWTWSGNVTEDDKRLSTVKKQVTSLEARLEKERKKVERMQKQLESAKRKVATLSKK